MCVLAKRSYFDYGTIVNDSNEISVVRSIHAINTFRIHTKIDCFVIAFILISRNLLNPGNKNADNCGSLSLHNALVCADTPSSETKSRTITDE